MRRFEEYNPLTTAVYYLCVIFVTMFSMDPVILAVSLISSVLTFCLYWNGKARDHLFALVLFLILMLINPLVSHNGVTVLFYLNDRPFTLEATLYGAAAAAMVTAALYRLRSFTREMTSDKLIYLTGRLSPKLSLLLSMAIRYVALFKHRWQVIRDSQKALGLFDDGNLIDAIRGRVRVLNILVTWALEQGIVTAESMEARGYGSRRRTSFAIYRITATNVLLILLILGLTTVTAFGVHAAAIDYYPSVAMDLSSPLSLAGYFCYGLVSILPVIINTKEAIKWRCLRSEI